MSGDMIALSFSLVFMVEFVKALPWPAEWKQRKPLSCSACLTGWALILLAAVHLFVTHSVLGIPRYTAAGGLALLLLALFNWLKSQTFTPPVS